VSPFSYLAKMGRRQIKSNWSQFLAIIAIGGLAVTLFVGLLANADSFEARVNSAYDQGNMADVWVTTNRYDKTNKAAIRSIVGPDAEIEGRFETSGRIGRNLVYPTVVPAIPTISKPYEVETDAQASQDDFVYIDTALANGADQKYSIGDALSVSYDFSSLSLPSEAKATIQALLLDPTDPFLDQTGVLLNYTISGIMKFPENIQKAAYSPSIVLISASRFQGAVRSCLLEHFSPENLETVFEYVRESSLGWDIASPATFPQANQYLVTFPNHQVGDAVERLKDSFMEKGADSNLLSVNDRSNMPFVATVHNDAVQARQFTFLFPFVFFFVGVLVILTTTSQMVLKERTKIGTLKALGLSRGQIYQHYLLLTDAVVGIGIAIGLVVGPLLIPAIMDKKYSIIYTLPARTYSFPVLYGLLTAVAFLLVSSLVTFLICRKEVRLNPAESMRPAAPKIPGKSSFLSVKRPSSMLLSFKMAFRNIRFSLGKSAMVVVGVTGCTALLVCGFGIEDSINYGIDHDMSLYNNASLLVAFSGYKSKDEIIADLETLPDVDTSRCDPIVRQTSTLKCDDSTADSFLYILSFDPSAPDSHFQLPAFDHATVAISEKVAKATGAQLGDTISFSYQSVSYSAPVGLIYQAFAFNGLVAVSDAPFWESPVTYAGAYLETFAGTEEASSGVKEEILQQTAAGQRFSYVTECSTKGDWHDQIKDVMSGVLLMTNAVKYFGIALAVVVLYNLALLNFRERTRDIATLKVLGFSRREIASSLLWETMTLTFVGVGLGFAMGYPFLLGVMGLNIVELVSYFYVINPASYGLAFLLTFVVDFAVNGGLSLLTGRVKMVESLKSVE